MKCFRPLCVLLLGMVLASCASIPLPARPSRTPSLVGKWVNSDGSLLRLNGDGSFDLVLGESTKPQVWGEYALSHGRIEFFNQGGRLRPARCNHGVGVYRFQKEENTLRFRRINDSCAERARQLVELWRRP